MLFKDLHTATPNADQSCDIRNIAQSVFLVVTCLYFAGFSTGFASEMVTLREDEGGHYAPATEKLPASYRLPEISAQNQQSSAKGGVQTLLSEDFEGRFPSGLWSVFAADNGLVEAYWKKTNYRSYDGDKSAAAARGGPDGVPAGHFYPHGVRSWAVYGPMDFSDAQSGEFSFKHSTHTQGQFDYLFWGVSIDGESFSGNTFTGLSDGWVDEVVDLTDQLQLGTTAAEPQVWIALIFASDDSGINGEGSYIDNVEVRKNLSSSFDLKMESVSVPVGNYERGSLMAISNSTRNIGLSSAAAYQISFYLSTDEVISTSDYLLATLDRPSALSFGEEHTFNDTVVIPRDHPNGTYYIGAIINGDDNNSANDINVHPVTITTGVYGEPEIDLSPTSLTVQLAETTTSTGKAQKFAASQGTPFELKRKVPILELKIGRRGAADAVFIQPVEGALATPHQSLLLQLPEGPLVAFADAYENRTSGSITWRGTAEHGGSVVLTEVDGVMGGMIHGRSQTYYVHSTIDGRPMLSIVDAELLPPLSPNDGKLPATAINKAVSPNAGFKTDSQEQIKVLAVYTDAVLSNAANAAQVRAEIQTAVDMANSSFANSRMTARLELVHTAKVDYTEQDLIDDDLEWVMASDRVRQLRDLHQADLVAMFGEYSGYCGVANVMRDLSIAFEAYAFQVMDIDCISVHTYTHENGHLMGMEHNPEDESSAPPDEASYPWSYGHYHSGRYRTIMSYAYECSTHCPRAPYFSNPSVSHMGLPTGIAGSRDNHQTGNLTGDIVANFRSSNRARFSIANWGNGPLSINQIYADSVASAWLDFEPMPPFDIAPTSSQTVHVSVDFSRAPAGNNSIRLNIDSNDSDENPYPGGVTLNVLNDGFSTNAPPHQPAAPSPDIASDEVDLGVSLGFSGGDPDGQTVTYDVFLEANDPSPDVLVCDDVLESTCQSLGVLELNTVYYWQVIATDSLGATSTGPVWSFSTVTSPPSCEALTGRARLLCLLRQQLGQRG